MSLEPWLDTFSSHMSRALYGRHGYYQHVVKLVDDFTTHATKGRGLAFILVNFFHRMYREQVESGQRSLAADKRHPFFVVELSGGNGQLANNILNFLEYLSGLEYPTDSQRVSYYKELWQDFKYTVYEISDKLFHEQIKLNAVFIAQRKLQLKHQSALEIAENSVIDCCFSNEFWDVLGFEKILIENDTAYTLCPVPYLDKELISEYIPDEFINKNELIREKIDPQDQLITQANCVPIFKETYETLEKVLSDGQWNKFSDLLSWKEILIPLHEFPDLYTMLEPYLPRFIPSQMHLISPDLITMAQRLKNCKVQYHLHFDYGGALKDASPSYQVRYYPSEENNRNYYFQPHVDITSDVDFGMLRSILSTSPKDSALHSHLSCMNYLLSELPLSYGALCQADLLEETDLLKFIKTHGGFRVLIANPGADLERLSLYDFPCIHSNAGEKFPDHPMTSITSGLPFDRSVKNTGEERNKINFADEFKFHLFKQLLSRWSYDKDDETPEHLAKVWEEIIQSCSDEQLIEDEDQQINCSLSRNIMADDNYFCAEENNVPKNKDIHQTLDEEEYKINSQFTFFGSTVAISNTPTVLELLNKTINQSVEFIL